VGYDSWLNDFLDMHQPADSSFRIPKPADAHPAQEIEEIKRTVIENATNLLTSLRMIDTDDTGFIPVQDFRGALYLKLGLKPEQVDSLVCGVNEGLLNYPDWIQFFTTNPISTTSDFGQFIRYGGASSTGNRAQELSADRLMVSELGPQTLPPLYCQPGIDKDMYGVREQVSDIHTTETEDIRAQQKRRSEEVMEELRKEALGRQHLASLAVSPHTSGTQHLLSK